MRLFIGVCCTMILYSSCVRNIYVQAPVYAPVVVERNEVEIQGGSTPDGISYAGAAWAFTNRLHLMTQASAVGFTTDGTIMAGIGYRGFMKGTDTVAKFGGYLEIGYVAGRFSDSTSRSTNAAAKQFGSRDGYVVIDMSSKYQGGYWGYCLMVRDGKRELYTGSRVQFLCASEIKYTAQLFVPLTDGSFVPTSQFVTNPDAVRNIAIANVYLGYRFGWKYCRITAQAQWRFQYTGMQLNNHWKRWSAATGLVAITIPLGRK